MEIWTLSVHDAEVRRINAAVIAAFADPAVKEKSAYIQAAFLVGWAVGGSMTAPNPTSVQRCIQGAVAMAGIRPEQIGGDCEGCHAAILAGFRMIYTRRAGGGGSGGS